MFKKPIISFLFILSLIFIAYGDSFLPQPLSTASWQTRTAINSFVIGMFPSWRPKEKPYERTEKAIDDTEKGGGSQ